VQAKQNGGMKNNKRRIDAKEKKNILDFHKAKQM